MTQSNIPEGATHISGNGVYYKVTEDAVIQFCNNTQLRPTLSWDVKSWLTILKPLAAPSVKPYNAFTAELDKLLQLRGLELLNAMQRKIEASEGIPIEWLNELMDFHGVSV